VTEASHCRCAYRLQQLASATLRRVYSPPVQELRQDSRVELRRVCGGKCSADRCAKNDQRGLEKGPAALPLPSHSWLAREFRVKNGCKGVRAQF
jgi:hypothetical protein